MHLTTLTCLNSASLPQCSTTARSVCCTVSGTGTSKTQPVFSSRCIPVGLLRWVGRFDTNSRKHSRPKHRGPSNLYAENHSCVQTRTTLRHLPLGPTQQPYPFLCASTVKQTGQSVRPSVCITQTSGTSRSSVKYTSSTSTDEAARFSAVNMISILYFAVSPSPGFCLQTTTFHQDV